MYIKCKKTIIDGAKTKFCLGLAYLYYPSDGTAVNENGERQLVGRYDDGNFDENFELLAIN